MMVRLSLVIYSLKEIIVFRPFLHLDYSSIKMLGLLFVLCLNLCRLYNILWQRRFTNTVCPWVKAHCILWRITNTVYYHYYEKVEKQIASAILYQLDS